MTGGKHKKKNRPNSKCAQNHSQSKVAHPRHPAKQQRKPGEEGTGKHSDKLGKSAVSSQ